MREKPPHRGRHFIDTSTVNVNIKDRIFPLSKRTIHSSLPFTRQKWHTTLEWNFSASYYRLFRKLTLSDTDSIAEDYSTRPFTQTSFLTETWTLPNKSDSSALSPTEVDTSCLLQQTQGDGHSVTAMYMLYREQPVNVSLLHSSCYK